MRWCTDFVEAEAEYEVGKELGVPTIAPWYYRHLGIVYRKDSRYDDEIQTLERYVEACEKVSSEPQDDMLDRLEKARSLAADD